MTIIDPLESDIKRALITSPNARLQWYKIKEELLEKYKYDERTFRTILHRKLKRLRLIGDLEREVLGHQQVFYFIPRNRLEKIKDELDKEMAHRAFDDIWQSLSPEQRKRELKNLVSQRFQVTAILRNTLEGLMSLAGEQMKDLTLRLENPTDDIKEKSSPEERRKLLDEFHNITKDFDAITQSENHSKINESEWKAHLQLIRDFLNKVVNPRYSGNWNKAITELMRKAVQDQEIIGKKE